ncbi:ABC transporter-like protein, partial [Aspergillus sclerotiicarbonarius CBS 121057]
PLYRWEGRGLGVSLEHVTVLGNAQGHRHADDFGSILWNLAKAPITLARRCVPSRRPEKREIIRDLTGVLFPGETLLVLGNPGAGCSTTLKVIASNFEGYREIQGNVQYAGLSSQQIDRDCRSEVVYNNEEDIHFPTLKVKHAMDFGLQLRRPARDPRIPSEKQFARAMTDRILTALGISHTKGTIVGNSFVRGVSGGERKRVSLAEVLTVNPAIACWDNPIRGLDSSSALDFLSTLKQMSKANGMVNAVSLYQASEAMYQSCFDKVLLLYEGRIIYLGPVSKACDYFVGLGFQPLHRQSTPEFLISVTSPYHQHSTCSSVDPDYLAERYRSSEIYSHVLEEVSQYRSQMCQSHVAEAFRSAVNNTVSKHRMFKANEPSTIAKQVRISTRRYFRLLWSDRNTFYTILALTIVNALVCGSAFYDAPRTSTGAFMRSCALYFPLVYLFLNSLTEVNKTIDARSILLKQHKLGYINPVSFVVTQAVCDLPSSFVLTVIFSCCYYFLVGFNKTASQFWIFILITFAHYGSVSAMFRMLGAWSPSTSVALLVMGAAIPIVTLYAGYAPPLPTQHRWGSWLRRVAPTPYALEALMSNEFYNIQLHCTENELVPSGPGYGNLEYQGCSLPGAEPGSVTSSGADYLSRYYEYSRDHLWRNFGIILAFWFLYTGLAALGLTIMTRETAQTSGPVFKRGVSASDNLVCPDSGPTSGNSKDHDASFQSDGTLSDIEITESTGDSTALRSLFTFENITYTVKANNKPKRLLNNVNGYVRVGQLTALMGASGAGKTTLLDTLSQRKSEGQVEGTMLMEGRPIHETFARSCGFFMQQDIHEPFTTVREALQFSAYLRQPAERSYTEKMQYVDHVIHLLELGPIADALIGEAGDGKLGVEERKRVTIGVELAARPSGLLFLDEPTSGLDSQAAYSIVSFLQRIAAEGIPVICTIHQPSGVIFEMFDHVLLLAPGGNTVYFGETGLNSQRLVEYFGRYGATITEGDNPAEFVISKIANKGPGARDWVQTWQDSAEATQLKSTITALKEMAMKNPLNDSACSQGRFAQPLSKQIYAVTKRYWITVWRHGTYNFSRVFKAIWYELIISFTFFHEGTDLQSLQNRMLGVLLVTWIIPVNAADIQAVWFDRWAIFEGRERNGIYDYKALLCALIAVEIPWNIMIYTLVFFCSFWTMGFTNTPVIAGFTYFMFLLLSLFGIGFCCLMATFFPNRTMAGYANSLLLLQQLFWVVLLIFSGLPIPHSAMNNFYRPWLFWTDPMRYFFGGTISTIMHQVPVQCKPRDYTQFIPPAGQTCSEYAGRFLASHAGYLVDPNATDICSYCKYSTGDDYLDTLNFGYRDRWRDWAVFLGFCLTNIVLVFIGTWFLRVKMRQLKTRFGKK